MDLDQWINDARRTERSVTLYQRADLIADLDDLDRRITLTRAAGDDPVALVEEWQTVAQRFAASALTIRVRGLSASEIKAMQAEALLERLELDEVGIKVIAAACVAPTVTPEQVTKLVDVLGESQVMQLGRAVMAACIEPPQVGSDD